MRLKIKDKKKYLQTVKIIAQIQAIAVLTLIAIHHNIASCRVPAFCAPTRVSDSNENRYIAGEGQQAVKIIETILTDRNSHLPTIASLLVDTSDKTNFKQLLIPCACYLDAAYEICGYLARLYPDKTEVVAKIVSEFSEVERVATASTLNCLGGIN